MLSSFDLNENWRWKNKWNTRLLFKCHLAGKIHDWCSILFKNLALCLGMGLSFLGQSRLSQSWLQPELQWSCLVLVMMCGWIVACMEGLCSVVPSAWKRTGFEVRGVTWGPRSAAYGTCDSEQGVSSLWMLASSALSYKQSGSKEDTGWTAQGGIWEAVIIASTTKTRARGCVAGQWDNMAPYPSLLRQIQEDQEALKRDLLFNSKRYSSCRGQYLRTFLH